MIRKHWNIFLGWWRYPLQKWKENLRIMHITISQHFWRGYLQPKKYYKFPICERSCQQFHPANITTFTVFQKWFPADLSSLLPLLIPFGSTHLPMPASHSTCAPFWTVCFAKRKQCYSSVLPRLIRSCSTHLPLPASRSTCALFWTVCFVERKHPFSLLRQEYPPILTSGEMLSHPGVWDKPIPEVIHLWRHRMSTPNNLEMSRLECVLDIFCTFLDKNEKNNQSPHWGRDSGIPSSCPRFATSTTRPASLWISNLGHSDGIPSFLPQCGVRLH